MRYLMKEKLIALGEDFMIQDESGRDVYFVDGKALSFGDKLVFKDMAGNELARIEQKLLAWGPTYEVYRSGQQVATVKKSLFTLFRSKFSVDVPGPDDLEATGSLLDHEYEFQRRGRTVATVSKKWFSFTDSYGIDIIEGENDVLILASAVVIDLCCHGDEKGRH